MVSRIDAQGHHLGHERHMVGHGAKLHRHLKFESAIKGPHVLGAVTEEQMPGRTKLSRDPSAALPSIGKAYKAIRRAPLPRERPR